MQCPSPPAPAPCLQLRSLDLSGTQANDCLLLWLAQRGCGRLQKLMLSNTLVTGAWGCVRCCGLQAARGGR